MGGELRNLRKQLGMTQRELAFEFNSTEKTVSNYENSHSPKVWIYATKYLLTQKEV